MEYLPLAIKQQRLLALQVLILEPHRWCNWQRDRHDLIFEPLSDQSKYYKIRIAVSSLDIVGE